jgi:hypothetical protein
MPPCTRGCLWRQISGHLRQHQRVSSSAAASAKCCTLPHSVMNPATFMRRKSCTCISTSGGNTPCGLEALDDDATLHPVISPPPHLLATGFAPSRPCSCHQRSGTAPCSSAARHASAQSSTFMNAIQCEDAVVMQRAEIPRTCATTWPGGRCIWVLQAPRRILGG